MMLMRNDDLKCPRCGNTTQVTRHMLPVPAETEADVWMPVRDEGYQCSACHLIESCLSNSKSYEELRNRWNDPILEQTFAERLAIDEEIHQMQEANAREWDWPTEMRVTSRERRAVKLEEQFAAMTYYFFSVTDAAVKSTWLGRLPQHPELTGRILANPDDDAPRWELAAWLRKQDDLRAPEVAGFIEGQLRLATALRMDPRADITGQLKEGFSSRPDTGDAAWWRLPRDACLGHPMADTLSILEDEGVIASVYWYRGCIEHVAIKASRFLEIADELYSLAPVRHLTITYAKGHDHSDTDLWKALLESPHLDRIRSLRLPVCIADRPLTELNRLTDVDLELLASSQHLRKLAHLDLEDETHLTERAFHALAASRNLPALSMIRHDVYSYEFPAYSPWGNLGKRTRGSATRQLARYADALEATHGTIPWLHPLEHYGTDAPDLEAVVEHPVALLARPG